MFSNQKELHETKKIIIKRKRPNVVIEDVDLEDLMIFNMLMLIKMMMRLIRVFVGNNGKCLAMSSL